MKAGIRDEQKSKALQACRLFLDAYDDVKEDGFLLRRELDQAAVIARSVVGRPGGGIRMSHRGE